MSSSRVNRDKLLGGGDQNGRRTIISDKEFRDKIATLRVERTGNALKVSELDLLEKDNRKAHHTEDYEQEDLIVRRGQKFSLACTFDRNVSKTQDVIIFKFVYGARPQESKGTIVRVPVIPADSNIGWDSQVEEVKDKTIKVNITPDADCNIGKYSIFIETKLKDSKKDFTKDDTERSLYVLFNAWCKEDVVYMADEKERSEYVLNDTGRIWVGSVYSFQGLPWCFGQFEVPVLEETLGLLDKGELADAARHSAVSVVRCLSALANNMGDSGVLTGCWATEYPEDCTHPCAWTGSVRIIEQFHETKKPVKFGQCWVFSGLVTTLLRALGIPTRSVTNFASAHDNDCSMTIDEHFDEDGDPIKHLNDSVWNFHVWNESFFRRIDLPEGYDGWQAHDATPQEASEGVMRCGPAPVIAVKKGQVYLNFDTSFIFGEVNGDKIQWTVKQDGSMEVMEIDKHSVGKKISTKAVGSNARHDLTNEYKYTEGSAEERKVVEAVHRLSTRRHINIYKKDIKKEVIVPERCTVENDITVGVKVKNTTNGARNLKVRLTVASAFYTGIVGKKIKGEVTEVRVGALEEKKVFMTCTPKEYQQLMNAEFLFNLTVSCKVMETDKLFATVQPFYLKGGELTIQVDKKIPKGTFKMAIVTFRNATNLKLHEPVIHVEGSSMVKQNVFLIGKEIQPGGTISVEVPLFARRTGEREIMARFSSKEISGVVADASLCVESA